VPLTRRIFRLPATSSGVVLFDDEAFLTGAGYVFARGVRNSFDPAFNAAGELFSGDNSGDRDDSDELNWLREGGHYGFPWRMGTNDTPQQQPGYNPEADKLVDHRFYAYQHGFFHDDPTYPPRPSVPLIDPIPNLGTDANSFRDPATGALDEGERRGAVARAPSRRIARRWACPSTRQLAGRDATGEAPSSWAGRAAIPAAIPCRGPFRDASQDLLFLDLQRTAAGYEVRAQSVVCGFLNPIDTEILNGRLYVLEFGGSGDGLGDHDARRRSRRAGAPARTSRAEPGHPGLIHARTSDISASRFPSRSRKKAIQSSWSGIFAIRWGWPSKVTPRPVSVAKASWMSGTL
jgi:hypothetical protein